MESKKIQLNNSFITLNRQVLEWEWYTDNSVKSLFIHCLLKANWKDKNWQGQEIRRGQFVTSYGKLALETGLTIRQVRTALSKLKATQEIAQQATSQYSIITVKKYNDYQDCEGASDKQMTSERQASDKRATTTNNKNKENNINTLSIENFYEKNQDFKFHGEYKNVGLTDKISIDNKNKNKNKIILGEFKNIFLSDENLEKVKFIYGNKFEEAIEVLSSYIESSGKKYKSHYAVLCKHNWVYKKVITEKIQEKKEIVYNAFA